MKIIFRQANADKSTALGKFDVKSCYLKKLTSERDYMKSSKKTHYHTGFEIHIVTEGNQHYEVADKVYNVRKGEFLLIYPGVEHKVLDFSRDLQKYSVTFYKENCDEHTCYIDRLSERMSENLDYIQNEAQHKKEISDILIENTMLEILISIFRLTGFKEKEKEQGAGANEIAEIAKQYIDDNIKKAPSVEEVARYCYLSTRQLGRIFVKYEGMSPKEYITKKRIEKIEALLQDQTISLKQISTIMNFDNEYYFNTFFKLHAGMPPGEYRKMFVK